MRTQSINISFEPPLKKSTKTLNQETYESQYDFWGLFWGPLTSEWKATHLLSNCWCCNIISLTRLLKWFLIRASLVSLSLAPLVTWSSCPSCRERNKNYYIIKFQAQVKQTVLLPVLFSTCSQKDEMFHNWFVNAVSSITYKKICEQLNMFKKLIVLQKNIEVIHVLEEH